MEFHTKNGGIKSVFSHFIFIFDANGNDTIKYICEKPQVGVR